MYFYLLPRLQKFSINTPVQAVPGLLLLLAVDCTTRGMMTRVALLLLRPSLMFPSQYSATLPGKSN